ncbi:MAG TPA: flagellar biosynthesis protein FlgA [Beutenbergiaceae bacterium]|nr:flagellar biosynthesis protein FlgA [Beutenbergiaceae bacterium]
MAETPGVLRIRRPSWRDPRLGVGIVLVAASVALGSWLFTRADQTVEVYAARDVLVPGQQVSAADLDVIPVHLQEVHDTYLTAEQEVAEDAIVLRTVGGGELIPAAAIGSGAQVELRPVTIPASAATASSVRRGDQVDVWVARPDPESTGQDRLEPELLLPHAHVAEVREDTSLFAGTDQMHVEILVRADDLAPVLSALSSGAEVYLVRGAGG